MLQQYLCSALTKKCSKSVQVFVFHGKMILKAKARRKLTAWLKVLKPPCSFVPQFRRQLLSSLLFPGITFSHVASSGPQLHKLGCISLCPFCQAGIKVLWFKLMFCGLFLFSSMYTSVSFYF